jgi:hypothetical protein
VSKGCWAAQLDLASLGTIWYWELLYEMSRGIYVSQHDEDQLKECMAMLLYNQ